MSSIGVSAGLDGKSSSISRILSLLLLLAGVFRFDSKIQYKNKNIFCDHTRTHYYSRVLKIFLKIETISDGFEYEFSERTSATLERENTTNCLFLCELRRCRPTRAVLESI